MDRTPPRPAPAPAPPRPSRDDDDADAPPARRRTALSNRGGEIVTGGHAEDAEVLADAWRTADAADPDTFTHGFHAWPARMHPSIATALIEHYTDPGDIVVDPFCGGGSVLVEAVRLGRRAIGTDLNPLAARVAVVRGRPIENPSALLELASEVTEETKLRVRAKDKTVAPLPPALTARYEVHVLKELSTLLEEITKVRDDVARATFAVVFSAIAVKLSKQRSDTDTTEVHKRIGRFHSAELFESKVQELVERHRALAAHTTPGGGATALTADARHIDQHVERFSAAAQSGLRPTREVAGRQRARLVLTSPPYGGTYNYVDHHALRLAWLQLDDSAFRTGEIGARRDGEEGGAARFDRELSAALAAMARSIRADGHVVLVLGDGQIGTERVRADEQVLRLAPDVGLVPHARASQRRRDWQGGADRFEHLLMLKPSSSRASW